MGINIKNNIRLVNAKLGAVNIDRLGTVFAVQYNLDGISMANITVEAPPEDVKDFLEGDSTRLAYPLANNITHLVDYVFSAFPNITDIYMFSTTMVTISANAFTGLNSLTRIWVPASLLDTYKTTYTSLASKFVSVIEDYVLTIPHEIGESTTITLEYFMQIVNGLTSQQKNAITKVVFDDDFTKESVDELVWKFNFSNVFPLLNQNIWYGDTQYDFSVFTLVGSGALTNEIVSANIGSISSDKLSVVTKVIVPIDFTSYESGTINAIQNAFTNLRYLETCYEAGNMELDLQGDVVAKIVSIGKTLDEALVYAKNTFYNIVGTPNALFENNDIIIAPPYEGVFPSNLMYAFRRCDNLVYIDKIVVKNIYISNVGYPCTACNNLLEIKEWVYEHPFTISYVFTSGNIKRAKIVLTGNETIAQYYGFLGSSSLEYAILQNFRAGDFKFDYSTNFTREALVDLLNSLGTPATTKTFTIGATNLAKLTAEDIAIATQKNWVLQ